MVSVPTKLGNHIWLNTTMASPAGLRQTAGLYSRRDMIAEDDADVVRLMKEAGGIMLGVTNVSEMCMWWESSNTIYGRTSNPYNTNRIVGGSSGGEVNYLKQCWNLIVVFTYSSF